MEQKSDRERRRWGGGGRGRGGGGGECERESMPSFGIWIHERKTKITVELTLEKKGFQLQTSHGVNRKTGVPGKEFFF